jgi:hypothetical protein
VLTNGLNTVTLHATDLAGNVTTTNVSLTLDYSADTNPPVLTVIWPQDGTAIGGSSFTLQAQVDDDTATVMAQIVDANGDTNTAQGLVERSGRVWVQNLPLAAGTNTLTVTATDAAGNTSVTDLTLVQSPVTITMNPLSSDQLNQAYVTVTGTLNDPNYQRIVQTKVMIAPQGMVALAMGLTNTTPTTQTYLVRACAASFSQRVNPARDLFSNSPHDNFFNFITGGIWNQQWYAGNVPLPPEWLQINRQTLVNSGIVNSDGSVWGLTIVQGQAGATVDVTPSLIPTVTLTNNDYTFNVQVGGLQIVDANTGTVLTGQTNEVIVGQQMNLKCQLMISNEVITVFPLTNFQWTVPGFAISNYVVAAGASSAVVYTNFPTTKSNVVFYWVDGASNRAVQCSATAQGKTFTAQATFNVLRPTGQIMVFTGTIAVDANYNNGQASFFALHYGTASLMPGIAGILFTNQVTMPPGNNYNYGNTSFTVEWIQEVNSSSRQFQTNTAGGAWYERQIALETNSVLDTGYPYPGSVSSSEAIDAPAESLDNSTNSVWKTVSTSDNFTMWLMFKPAGGQWVPLKGVTWTWAGTAILNAIPTNGNYWSLTGSSNGNATPTNSDSTTYPQWNDNIVNHTTIILKP